MREQGPESEFDLWVYIGKVNCWGEEGPPSNPSGTWPRLRKAECHQQDTSVSTTNNHFLGERGCGCFGDDVLSKPMLTNSDVLDADGWFSQMEEQPSQSSLLHVAALVPHDLVESGCNQLSWDSAKNQLLQELDVCDLTLLTLSGGLARSSMRRDETYPKGSYGTSGQWASGEPHYLKMEKQESWGKGVRWGHWVIVSMRCLGAPRTEAKLEDKAVLHEGSRLWVEVWGIQVWEEMRHISREPTWCHRWASREPALLEWELQNWRCHCISPVKNVSCHHSGSREPHYSNMDE